MRMIRSRWIATLGLLPALLLAGGGIADALRVPDGASITGFTGYDLKTDELLFRAVRVVSNEASLVRERTVYSLGDGSRAQDVVVVYHASDMELVSYEKRFPFTGERERMVKNGDTVRLSYRPAAADAEKSVELDWHPGMLYSNMVMARMLTDAGRLAAGEEIVFDLLVPSRLDTYRFRLRKQREVDLEGRQAMVVLLEPDSWLIRRFVPEFRFYLSATAPYRLLEYRGRTTVKNKAGTPIWARLVYEYGDSETVGSR